MDLTIIRIHVKKILTGNFVFMSLVAIIFGILTLFSKGQEKIIGSYTYIDMLWKGYIFLYIIFACELSKDLLQMEKITRRIEWLIANGTRLQSILINHTVSLWISTLLLLMPLLGITIYKIGSPDVAQILDFFTFTLLSSIIINAVILVIRDMNKYKGISLRISVFYFFILIIESMFYSWSNNFILTVIIKYVISLCVRVCLKKAFRSLHVPICGRFCLNEGGVAGYGD